MTWDRGDSERPKGWAWPLCGRLRVALAKTLAVAQVEYCLAILGNKLVDYASTILSSKTYSGVLHPDFGDAILTGCVCQVGSLQIAPLLCR